MPNTYAENKCPGTGKSVPADQRMMLKTKCPECGREGIVVRVNGTLREHSKLGNYRMT